MAVCFICRDRILRNWKYDTGKFNFNSSSRRFLQTKSMIVFESVNDPVMQLSDRIMVMCGGKVSGIVDPRKVTKEEIGLMMIRTEQDGEKEEVTE